MKRLVMVCWSFCIVLTLMDCQTVLAQVPEIPRRGLGGIARVEMTRNGPAIYYNPRSVRRIGPEAWSFFRAHEYAHIKLGHFHRNISKQQAEAEADSYAARTASPSAVAAARRMFESGWGGSREHGSAATRAARLSGGSASYTSDRNRIVRSTRLPSSSSLTRTHGVSRRYAAASRSGASVNRTRIYRTSSGRLVRLQSAVPYRTSTSVSSSSSPRNYVTRRYVTSGSTTGNAVSGRTALRSTGSRSAGSRSAALRSTGDGRYVLRPTSYRVVQAPSYVIR